MTDESEEKSSRHRSWLERLTDLVSREPKDKEQLIEILRDAEERDLLSAEVFGMIESVLQVSDMQVREIMIPQSRMIAFTTTSTLETILPIVIESGHSRFPIVADETNEIVGILLAKDLLRYYINPSAPFSIQDILRHAVFAPQSKRLDILLKEFRIKRNHMAIVIDEYGHVSGLVTIEDVLEQIVGEIEDEYDIDEDDHIKKHPEQYYTVKAATPIDDFNDYFNTQFSDEEFDTIGGLVLQGFGHLPKRGEALMIQNFHFKILHSDNRRIHLLEVKKIEEVNEA